MFTVSDGWKEAYPGAHAGVLVMRNLANPDRHPELDRLKGELEDDLRSLFRDLAELKALGPIQAYQAYYKRFKKTYHVVQQLESVLFKGKPIPRVAALVEAMFMAELRNMLLTAGHDLDLTRVPLEVDIARGTEQYTRINGQEQILKPRDMMITDREGVISSVIYGPDRRTMINPATRNAVFTCYAVPGVTRQAVEQHMEGIESNVRVFSPDASVELMTVFSA